MNRDAKFTTCQEIDKSFDKVDEFYQMSKLSKDQTDYFILKISAINDPIFREILEKIKEIENKPK